MPAADDQPRLEVQNLTHFYGGREILQDINISIAPGQVTCLLGPSGCGKSTTLRLIAGIEKQRQGRIFIDGALMADGRFSVAPENRSIGLMFQDFALFPHLSVAENVAYGLRGPRLNKARRASEMLERVHMERYAKAYPHELSGGEQQRVALARALAPKPLVMLMDEPFSGLDNRLRDGVRDDTLELLQDEKTAVLLVTHEPEEAMLMADEIALMRDGQIVQQGAAYNVYMRPVDRAAMAFFSEVNQIRARVEGALAMTPFGRFLAPGMPDGTEVEISFRPQHLKIDFDRNTRPAPSATEGTAARGIVKRSRFLGNESLVEFEIEESQTCLKSTVPGVFLPKAGTKMWLRIRRDKCFVFPSE